jgi:uncharacterized protein (UPF0548 family)
MFLVSRPSKEQIERFVADLATQHFSYPDVGASVYGAPKKYTIDHNRVRLGTGEEVWKRAVEATKRWEMFNLGWTELCWPEAPIRWGTDVAVLIRHFGFYSLNGSRIVYVMDDEDKDTQRYGFAYGTLNQHAEAGEERFRVEWHKKSDAVYYDLLAFSKPAHALSRIGYPVVRSLQKRFAKGSMASMVRWCGSK